VFAVRADQFPLIPGREKSVREAVMGFEVFGMLRHTPSLDVFR
jgi:hypothetical protein